MGGQRDAAHGVFLGPWWQISPWPNYLGGAENMIIVMKKNAPESETDHVIEWIQSFGYKAHPSRGVERTIIGVVGDDRGKAQLKAVEYLPGVEKIVPILKPYKLASREAKEENTIVRIDNLEIGGPEFIVMAGPCSIESEEQLMESVRVVKKGGAHILRGGAFKPRTSPYSFHGLEREGLKLLKKISEDMGIPVVTEVMNTTDVELVAEHADILQIGARNVQNFALLREVGRARKPVLLKRGMMTTIEELLMSAEYILSCGNERVILCERGIRTFETATRNTLDIGAVPVLRELTHLPVIVDPSHAAGYWQYVLPLARGAVAVGADGLLVEVHPEPEKALSDGGQSLKPERFYRLMDQVRALERTMRTEIEIRH
jgi:3-deoxy-7-phosphoheptulonate synthase